jgi:predicted nucleic acid-binding protein
MKLIYLNANLIYGECLKVVSGKMIKTGVLDLLRVKNYKFTTSILTKMEIIQRLIREKQLKLEIARKIYSIMTEKFNITQIESLNKKNLLTNTFIDLVIKSNLDFKDALHLEIASKQKLLVVTHDKKFIKNASLHKDKLKFYSKVCKPEELLNN